MLPVSCPPWPASITTRDSFNPRLRTRERSPLFGAFAGVMTFGSASTEVEALGEATGAGCDTGKLPEVLGIAAVAGFIVGTAAPGVAATAATGAILTGAAELSPAGGASAASFPRTSMI